MIEITLPIGLSVLEAGKLLNAAAREKGTEYPVFREGDADFWAENEADTDLRTQPGQTYRFKIPADSVLKTRAEQVEEYNNNGAPLGAIALAEACERLTTESKGTLFKNADGDKVGLRGSAPGVALFSSASNFVYVASGSDGRRSHAIAFALSVSARN